MAQPEELTREMPGLFDSPFGLRDMKIRTPHVEELGFQIAPMCDVLLVLLVFFISITATSALRSDRAIELPVGPNATKKATARSEALINVKWVPEKSAGVVAIESKVITDLPAVTEILSPRSKSDPTYRVVIRADRKTPAQYVEKVMAACAEAGVTDIAFSVLNRE